MAQSDRGWCGRAPQIDCVSDVSNNEASQAFAHCLISSNIVEHFCVKLVLGILKKLRFDTLISFGILFALNPLLHYTGDEKVRRMSSLTHIFPIFYWKVPNVTILFPFSSLTTFANFHSYRSYSPSSFNRRVFSDSRRSLTFESVRIDVNDALSLGRRVGIEQVEFYEI